MVTEESVKVEEQDREAAEEQAAAKKEDEVGFSAPCEQSLQELRSGEIVTGRVVQVSADMIMVDVGSKTEGMIPRGSYATRPGYSPSAWETRSRSSWKEGRRTTALILSRDKAAGIKTWGVIREKFENDQPIQGTITQRVKGGLTVDIGIPAFLPGSQVDIRPVRDLDRFVGQTMQFNILKFDRDRNNVVLSRRAIMEKERESDRKQLLETIEEGKVIEGIIKNITDYGLFIDLGGIDGLLTSPTSPGARFRSPRRTSARATGSG